MPIWHGNTTAEPGVVSDKLRMTWIARMFEFAAAIPRSDRDRAWVYVNPQPLIMSNKDISVRLEACKTRFTAWAQGGLNDFKETSIGRARGGACG